MREHKGDLRNHRVSNAFVAHVDEAGHLPDWARATSLKKDFTKTQRKIVEAAFIATEDTLNISQGFFRLASVAATLIRSEYNDFAQ